MKWIQYEYNPNIKQKQTQNQKKEKIKPLEQKLGKKYYTIKYAWTLANRKEKSTTKPVKLVAKQVKSTAKINEIND